MDAREALLFDLDGVLVDSRVAFARAVNAALIGKGLDPHAEADLHQYLGPPLHETFATLVPDRSLVQPCVDAYRARYRAFSAQETVVFPGVGRLLEALATDRQIVVATSKPKALAEPVLEALGLRDFFSAVIGPSLDAKNEHKAVTVRRALATLTGRPSAIMVGDREHDVTAAHANDIPAIGVLWGVGTRRELAASQADAVARDTVELEELLAGPIPRPAACARP